MIALNSFAANLPNHHPLEFGIFGEALSSSFRGFVLHESFCFTLVGSSRAWARRGNSLSGHGWASAASFGRLRTASVCV